MYKIKLLLASLAIPAIINAQSFGGTIEFKLYNAKDTMHNVYNVKGKNVKLDQFAKKSTTIEGSFVFDLNNNTIKFVHPKRKVWGEHKSEIPPVIKGKCEVTKTKNTKKLLGVKCTEYVVKNTEENTTISYWITDGNYEFFSPMVKLWNRKDKQSVYYNQLTGLSKGALPLLSEEKQISDGKLISKLEMIKITKAALDDNQISIPADYKKFEE